MAERYVEYSASVRQQITASVKLMLCTDCGALIGDTEAHDTWHEQTPAFHWSDHG